MYRISYFLTSHLILFMTKVHFSSKSILWETPQAFYDSLNEKYHFNTDVCAVKENAKCRQFYTPQQDGLKQSWQGRVWMNPPYGREIGKWVEKAYTESLHGCLVVSLLPARTDTLWYHCYINNQQNVTVRFLKGRLKFGNSQYPAPIPSMLVIFGII